MREWARPPGRASAQKWDRWWQSFPHDSLWGKDGNLPLEHEINKKSTSCCTEGVCRKTEGRKSEVLPHPLLVASGPSVSPFPGPGPAPTALHEAQGSPSAAVKFNFLVKHSQDTILFKARFGVYEYISF